MGCRRRDEPRERWHSLQDCAQPQLPPIRLLGPSVASLRHMTIMFMVAPASWVALHP